MHVLSIISCGMLENESKGREFNNKYLKNSLYCLTAKIDTGFTNKSAFEENVKEFARKYDMQITHLMGSMEIAEQSYLAARNNKIKKEF